MLVLIVRLLINLYVKLLVVAIRIKPGKAYNIYALEQNERIELLDFLIEIRECASKEYKRLIRYLFWTAEQGLLTNPEMFKRLNEHIYEFKTHGGIRVLCF